MEVSAANLIWHEANPASPALDRHPALARTPSGANRPDESEATVFSDPGYQALKVRIRGAAIPLRARKRFLEQAVAIFTRIADAKKRAAAVSRLHLAITLMEQEEERKQSRRGRENEAYEKQEYDAHAERMERAAEALLY